MSSWDTNPWSNFVALIEKSSVVRELGGPVILNSYVVKTKPLGMKNVLLVNTTEPAPYVTIDEKTKPCIYTIYDFTKGGIDIPDQRTVSLTCKQKTQKGTVVALAYIVDMARVNSQTIFDINTRQNKVNSFDFGWDLMM